MSTSSAADLSALIVKTLGEVVPDLGRSAGPDTPLIGEGAVVDSVGFINLLVSIESSLGGDVDLSTSFMERGDLAVGNPFRTVGSLASHIQELRAAGV